MIDERQAGGKQFVLAFSGDQAACMSPWIAQAPQAGMSVDSGWCQT
ncbi:MAG: hypothetical protein NTV55_08075 [Planctomycetota bacterium]|nr:hypothetical protein [Planctomycetota bacterium]